jgi:hypothetical protein
MTNSYELHSVNLDKYEIRKLYLKFNDEIREEFHILITPENIFESTPQFMHEMTTNDLLDALKSFAESNYDDLLMILRGSEKEHIHLRQMMKRFTEILYEYNEIKNLIEIYPEWFI